jgi:electron transfer flavoprotein-quinone oxidoreductase
LLTRSIGLQKAQVGSELVACGIKEVWELDRKILEDRFGLDGMNGLAAEFVGATEGVEGGAFLYTNRQSLSIGLVLSLSSLIKHKLSPVDLLDKFKTHSAIAPLLKGAKMSEYSAHVAPSGDYRLVPEKLYGDGVLVCGDAAGLFTNTGRSIEGMNHAVESGRQAALTVIEACKNNSFTASGLSIYEKKLQETFVLQDIANFKGAYSFLHNPDMFEKYPGIINETAERAFAINGQAKKKTREIVLSAMSEFHVSWAEAIKMGLKGGLNL